MDLVLYNTLTRKKEEFKPLKKGKVGMYSCGPTVYWYQHIGNLRAYLFSDILKRVLIYNGFKVNQIINVTDVGHLTSDADEGEDKMEIAALKEGKNAKDIANYYFKIFKEDFKKLNILEPSTWAWATEHIDEQIELIKKLEKKGFTYKTEDGIYFDSSKFKNYGKLALLNIDGLESGKRIAVGEKKNKTDFALWKFSSGKEKRQQEWSSPWGVGFPGWHIECSAMSIKYLGEHFDIHTGGEDHVPIHHTNELAQSEGATGKKFVNYWLHGAFLVDSDGKKVSKSTGGLYTISELEEKGYSAYHYRYLCLQTSYRKQLQFSLEALDASKNAYEKIKNKIIRLRKENNHGNTDVEHHKKQFLEAINNDLNMPQALEVFWEVMEETDMNTRTRLALLEDFDRVLGIGVKDMKEEKVVIPKDVTLLLVARQEARKKKMFAEADILRQRIKERGFVIEDLGEDGPYLRKID
ncbi:cysteine--tRNA ligase [Candidatus Pacearchaeota archaeon]|nr:cysteine--tRNA ligase [Candidatus Pacearchaeota archaeon]